MSPTTDLPIHTTHTETTDTAPNPAERVNTARKTAEKARKATDRAGTVLLDAIAAGALVTANTTPLPDRPPVRAAVEAYARAVIENFHAQADLAAAVLDDPHWKTRTRP